MTLPFNATATTGVDGFVLQRCPVQSLFLADMKRRLALGNAADPQPDVSDGGVSRADLKAWIDALPAWLAAYNAGSGGRSSSAWTMANVLTDSAARQAFVNHFYGGLLDDELRALADLPDNATGFARVNSLPRRSRLRRFRRMRSTGPVSGGTLYALMRQQRGTVSAATGSIGPYYTRSSRRRGSRPVRFSRRRRRSRSSGRSTQSPDVAAYLVYRGKHRLRIWRTSAGSGRPVRSPQTTRSRLHRDRSDAAAPGLVRRRKGRPEDHRARAGSATLRARLRRQRHGRGSAAVTAARRTRSHAVFRATDYDATRTATRSAAGLQLLDASRLGRHRPIQLDGSATRSRDGVAHRAGAARAGGRRRACSAGVSSVSVRCPCGGRLSSMA